MGLGSALGSIGRVLMPRVAPTSARTPSFMGDDDYEDAPDPDETRQSPPPSIASRMGGNAPAPPAAPASPAAAMGGNAPPTYRPELDPDSQKYLDAARQPAPMHPQHGRLRTIGESMAGGFLGPQMATELFDPKYAAQKRQYEHDLQSAALPAQVRAKAETVAATNSHTMAQGGLANQQAKLAGKQAENYDSNAAISAVEHGGEIQPDNPAAPPQGQSPREGSTLPVGGKNVFFPSKGQVAKETATAKKEAEQASYRPLPKEITESLGLPQDLKVPIGELDSYSRIYENKVKAKGLHFESHVDDITGDVTTTGRDPVTGEVKFKDALKGIARKRPQVTSINNEVRKDRTAGLKAYTPALESAERFNVMAKNYEDAIKAHDQQAMLSLLANHLGMTMGLQKGARLTKDIIHEAEQSRPWLQGLAAKFDGNGYLSGVNLTPEQMRQMVNLGRERFAEDISKGRSEAKYMGVDDDGPTRTASKATKNHYIHLANGDAQKASELMKADGWGVN